METDHKNRNTSYLRAKKRVEKLKGYYSHLTVYIIVNTIISAFKIINDVDGGDTVGEALLDARNYSLWFWWGIGIAFHTYGMFGARLLFMSKDWEEKKIKEFMNEK
jgi:hypothetical protein